MTTLVVLTDSVHASAALCDYLGGRVGEGDVVHAATRVPADAGREATRDAGDALNGVRSRLGAVATVETHRLEREEGDDGVAITDGPVAGLRTLADRTAADELVVASGDGGLDPAGVADVLAGAARPVVVVPR